MMSLALPSFTASASKRMQMDAIDVSKGRQCSFSVVGVCNASLMFTVAL